MNERDKERERVMYWKIVMSARIEQVNTNEVKDNTRKITLDNLFSRSGFDETYHRLSQQAKEGTSENRMRVKETNGQAILAISNWCVVFLDCLAVFFSLLLLFMMLKTRIHLDTCTHN